MTSLHRSSSFTLLERTTNIRESIQDIHQQMLTSGKMLATQDSMQRVPTLDSRLIDPQLLQPRPGCPIPQPGVLPKHNSTKSISQDVTGMSYYDVRSLNSDITKMQSQIQQLSIAVICGKTLPTEFLGGSGLHISTALSLLYPHLTNLVLSSEPPVKNVAYLAMLAGEFKNMLADSSRLAAAELTQSISLPKPRHRRRPTQPFSVQWQLLDSSRHSPNNLEDSNRRRRKRKAPMAEEIEQSFDLAIGKVVVYLSVGPFKLGYRERGPSKLGARLFFFPRPELQIRGITASVGFGLPRAVSSFGVHPCNSPIFEFLERRDFHGVQHLLSSGVVRPNDRDEDGESLLWVSRLIIS
jgi:hypothetical protein